MGADRVDLGPFEADLIFRLVAGVPALVPAARVARAAAAANVPLRLEILNCAERKPIVVSVSELAKERGVTARTVRRWCAEGRIDAVKVSGAWVVLR
jgi:hypothetical protein